MVNRRSFVNGYSQIFGIGDAAVDAQASWLGYDGSNDDAAFLYTTVASASSGLTRLIDVAVLSDTRAIFVCSDNLNSSYGTAVLLDISGTTVSVLDSIVFKSLNPTETTRICKLDDTHALVIYDGSTGEAARVIDVTGAGTDTLGLVGSEHSFTEPANLDTTWDIDTIDSSNVLISWRDNASPDDLEAMVLGVNTSTGAITENTVYTLSINTPTKNSGLYVNVYSSTKFTVSTNFSSTGVVLVSASYSGTTISNIQTKAVSSANLFPSRFWITTDENYGILSSYSTSSTSSVGIATDHNSTTNALTNTDIIPESNSLRGNILFMQNDSSIDYFLSVITINNNTSFAPSEGVFAQGFAVDYSNLEIVKGNQTASLITPAVSDVSQSNVAIEKITDTKALITILKPGSPNSNSPYFYIANL